MLDLEIRANLCETCDKYMTCIQPFNEDCGLFKSMLMSKDKETIELNKGMNQKDKVVQFPVDMDEMQNNILIELLNARKECTEQNLLTAHGCVAIIDALFYLIKETPRDKR